MASTEAKIVDPSPLPLEILVVEDEPAMQRLVWHHLEDEASRVTIVESGERALRHLASATPDVLLLDIMLPGMDGLEVLRRLSKRARTATVIVISAHADISTAVEALRLGADEFLPKPVDMDSLKNAIGRARAKVVR